jgi:cell division protein FtsW
MTTSAARGLEPLAVGSYDRRSTPRGQERVALNRDQIRERWRMGVEARALVLVTAVLLAFGLAVLYSASAIAAMQEGRGSAHYFLKQLSGVLVGAVAFAVAAKVDAEKWREWAWPIMGIALFTMLLTVLPFTKSIAPPIHGSRRFLLGGSIQPSEFAKLAVIVWTSMLLVKKQETGQLRRLSKGMLPFLCVVGSLAVLAALEPDLSVAMTFMLIMAIILFAGGVRIGHFIALGIMGIRCSGTSSSGSTTSCSGCSPFSARRTRAPRSAISSSSRWWRSDRADCSASASARDGSSTASCRSRTPTSSGATSARSGASWD